MVFSSCCRDPENPALQDRSAQPKCLFCHPEKLNLLSESEGFIVFRDIRPGAKEHLLIVPRAHVQNVKVLSKEDLPLVKEMEGIARQALLDLGAPEAEHVYGYHIPPVVTINHLHLHAFALPFKSAFRRAEYYQSVRPDGSKGWSWFILSSQLINTLESDRKVTVSPC
ncbi:hypothetical protein FRB99_007107 [Tulasnella sp. 403]|nr:hypothetical protein FRB99_007107 [Tulasnella sp. 403]